MNYRERFEELKKEYNSIPEKCPIEDLFSVLIANKDLKNFKPRLRLMGVKRKKTFIVNILM